MAGKKENIKSLFTNTRTRVIIIFTVALLVLAVVIGYIKFRSITSAPLATANVGFAPGGIQSIPGTANPTVQYARLQEEQNVNQAQKAAETGGSSIPTIIRTQALGEGVGVIGSENGQSGVGFVALATKSEEGTQKSLWLQALQDTSCSKSAVTKALSQGAQLTDLKAACNCAQLKDNGYNLKDLSPICPCKELKAAGYNANQLKDAGYNAARLRDCGFNACELRNAGFTAQQMKDAGFSDDELKGAGYSSEEIARAGGLPGGISAADVLKAGCNIDALTKLRKSGVSAGAIRRISGCSATQLKAAGFTAAELRAAGFTAADLKRAGFTPADLKAGGYAARDLLNAGFIPADLANIGYSSDDINAAEAELPPGITPNDVKKGNCTIDVLNKERSAGVSAKLIKQNAGCSAQVLKAAGFTDNDLANAGFTPQQIQAIAPLTDAQIKAAGCDSEQLKKLLAAGISAQRIKELNGCSAEALKNAGYSAGSLLSAGYTPAQLLGAGFMARDIDNAGLTPAELIANGRVADCSVDSLKRARSAGVSALTIKKTLGCSAKALKDAGFTAKELKDAGFTAAELKNAGFSAKDLKDAGYTAKELKDAGFSAKDLRAAGFSIADLKAAGFAPEDLKAAGFTARDLLNAGFNSEELARAGYSPSEIRAAQAQLPLGMTSSDVKKAGCDVESLKRQKAAGVSATLIKQYAGCSAAQLKAAGFSAQELKDAGFSAQELKDAGFSAKELKDAGFSPKDLREAGFSAQELKEAGFSAQDLKGAGFSAQELKDAGYTAAQLKVAGFSAQDLVAAGFNAQELKEAGFTAAQLKAAGVSAKDLLAAGYNTIALKNAGFSDAELQNAGLGSQVAGLDNPNLQSGAFNLQGIPSGQGAAQDNVAGSTQQLQAILNKQNQQMAEQRYQQTIQQKSSDMVNAANQMLAEWKNVSTQTYIAGNNEEEKAAAGLGATAAPGSIAGDSTTTTTTALKQTNMIKTGDVLYAVIDTSVNTDEPSPILATIVSGKLKGTKLIGSFTLPSNANKMVITFNTMSVPGAPGTTSISAYAIDPNTARTALSSKTNHHYLLRYGSLFASSFLEGFGNAFQSANTTVTIGGTGAGNNVTIANGVGRSTLENAVIGLATLGKTWGQQAQVLFSTPSTVEVFAGTPVGILFIQDVKSI